MSNDGPRLIADERGVWREDTHGRRYGIAWDEIAAVDGYKLDGVTEVYTVVELVFFENGHWLELNSDWYGFADVVRAVTVRLPGIQSDWFQYLEGLGVNDPPIVVWKAAVK